MEHHREGTRVGVDEVEVDLTLETHDREHGERIVAALELRGITVEPHLRNTVATRRGLYGGERPVRNPATYRL